MDHNERQRWTDVKEFKKVSIPNFLTGSVPTESQIPILFTDEEKRKLQQSGLYIPQNHTNKPFNLNNFAAAPSSLEKGNKQKGVTGH